MKRIVCLTLLVCATVSHAQNVPAGIFHSIHGEDPSTENEFYLSVSRKGTLTAITLICATSCLPNKPKPYVFSAQSYKGEKIKQIEANVWQVAMKFESSANRNEKIHKPFDLRLDLNAKTMSFDGKTIPLEKFNFQSASYHTMGDYGFESEMLFVSGKGKNREFLIKTRSAPEHEDEFLYFTSSRNEIHPIQATHWRYVLDPKAGGETHFAQLHADVAIPGQGPAQIKLDVVRTPATDVGFWLLRKNKSPTRFWQTNDSNTRRFRFCANSSASDEAGCSVLTIANGTGNPACSGVEIGTIVVMLNQGKAQILSDDQKGHLLDDDCKVVYSLEYPEEINAVSIKGSEGPAKVFVEKQPDP